MNVQMQTLSQPFMVTAEFEPEEIKNRKEKIFEAIKDTLPELPGFRKGHIPRKLAEDKFGVEKMYKQLIDDIYHEIAEKQEIVGSRNFRIFGDLSDTSPLRIEFIGEVKPTLELVDLDSVKIEKSKVEVSDEEVKDRLEAERKRFITELDATRTEALDHDCVYIDFEGRLEDEDKPFAGGSAKNYKIELNKDGKKQFIDNFEDQIVGMAIGETKDLHVTFPVDYRDKSKNGKKAIFTVTLNSIKQLILPDLQEVAIKKSLKTVDDLNVSIREEIKVQKQKSIDNEFKQEIIKKLIDNSIFSPVPLEMIENELERDWQAFLYRMGSSEEDFIKKNPYGKEHFKQNSRTNAEILIKTSLIFEKIAKLNNFNASDNEVEDYINKISDKKLREEKRSSRSMNMAKQTLINEKIIQFLESKYK